VELIYYNGTTKCVHLSLFCAAQQYLISHNLSIHFYNFTIYFGSTTVQLPIISSRFLCRRKSGFHFQAPGPIGPVLGDWNITVDVTGQTATKKFQVKPKFLGQI
jgi:hypothetical protein